jgi:hypothetical protein
MRETGKPTAAVGRQGARCMVPVWGVRDEARPRRCPPRRRPLRASARDEPKEWHPSVRGDGNAEAGHQPRARRPSSLAQATPRRARSEFLRGKDALDRGGTRMSPYCRTFAGTFDRAMVCFGSLCGDPHSGPYVQFATMWSSVTSGAGSQCDRWAGTRRTAWDLHIVFQPSEAP